MFFTMPDLRKIMPDLRKIMPDLRRIMPDLRKIMPDLRKIMSDLTWIMRFHKMIETSLFWLDWLSDLTWIMRFHKMIETSLFWLDWLVPHVPTTVLMISLPCSIRSWTFPLEVSLRQGSKLSEDFGLCWNA
uniref:Uncharacterized protein n=1 Tax=Brassica oleracea TaxID=3712 RepID=A0A3P6BS87_BRAOL|nr:unnamed protein product [Brassica oleracea]